MVQPIEQLEDDIIALAFAPVTHLYQTPGSAVETIPSGTIGDTSSGPTVCVIEVWGAGGGGGDGTTVGGQTDYGGSGASGGYYKITLHFGQADWGTTISYTVGAGGAATVAGSASLVATGTYSGSFDGTCGGGGAGASHEVGGTGGSSVGSGDANITGNNGVGTAPGAAGGAGIIGVQGVGYGAGGIASLSGSGNLGGAGVAGAVSFLYS